jgi:hypothetical protein
MKNQKIRGILTDLVELEDRQEKLARTLPKKLNIVKAELAIKQSMKETIPGLYREIAKIIRYHYDVGNIKHREELFIDLQNMIFAYRRKVNEAIGDL